MKINTWRYLLFYSSFTIILLIHMVPEIWNATDRIFCHLFFSFLPLYGSRKTKFWKNDKKGLEMSFYSCITNNDPIMNGSWDMEHDKQIFLFWAIFCPFAPQTTQKIKIFKKRNKHMATIILHLRTVNETHVMYSWWDMEHNRIFCHFGSFLALLPQSIMGKIEL